MFTININGQEIGSIMCTPRDQKDLVLGFMLNEGFINGFDEVGELRETTTGQPITAAL
jgi:formate dehydrogenase accessory protein FdhD